MEQATTIKPIVLIILDGWGSREETEHNAIAAAKAPTFKTLWETCPHITLHASGEYVGLPDGQMGNSEVGHLNLGAGRIVYQDFCRINNSIKNGEFFKNETLVKAIDDTSSKNHAIHIFGLLSPGGIHSHDTHIQALVRMAAQRGAKKIYVHGFLDGRDTPPKSAEAYIQNLEKVFQELGVGKLISITGRFYAMDRDKRWDRVEKAYHLFTLGEAVYTAETAIEGLKLAYEKGETDEFISPTSIHGKQEKPITINDGDSIIFMNFRSDRAREITRAFIEPQFNDFPRRRIVQLTSYVTLTQYDTQFNVPVVFPPTPLTNTLAEYLSKQHLRQLHIAETEKYAHVTFFFNGGVETPYEGEDRILVNSPKIATYDLQPEMSAREVTQKLIEAIRSQKYDFVICNFANPDMVGHTGFFDKTVQAIECLDECLTQIIAAIKEVKGETIITADHGNAEMMFDEITQQPHTAHTTGPVPFIYVGRKASIEENREFALCDIAPTVLTLLNISIPKEMTGQSIIKI
jgi:2,3-bisphosphoglycerate-independent phosphoglycerate mutase